VAVWGSVGIDVLGYVLAGVVEVGCVGFWGWGV